MRTTARDGTLRAHVVVDSVRGARARWSLAQNVVRHDKTIAPWRFFPGVVYNLS